MPDAQPARQLCCDSSLEAGEPLWATASRVDVWLLLEHAAAWGAKALPESHLSEDVKAFFNRQLEAIPNSRFQFIKQSAQGMGAARFFVVVSRPENPIIYAFHLPLDELTALDIPAVVSGVAAYQGAIFSEPLFLVCTNGKRDLACARHGLPLYQATCAYAGDAAWQTTHLGGHRFAGTLVCLPEGVCYGRAYPGDAENLIAEHRAGRIDLDHYRGRAGYDAPVQAAEYFLRQQTGNVDMGGLQFQNMEKLGDNQWTVELVTGDTTHRLDITSRLSDFELYESTANTEKSRVTVYELQHHETRTHQPPV